MIVGVCLSTSLSKLSRNSSKSVGVKGGAVSIGRGEKSKESIVLKVNRKVKICNGFEK